MKKIPARLAAALLLAAVAVCHAQEKLRGEVVEWSGKDAQGGEVKIPLADKATVLLFIRADQPQSATALQQAGVLLKAGKGVQALAVISGEEAVVEAQKLSVGGKWGGPVLADSKYELSGKMGVRVWPTTLVLTPAGKPVGHIGGLPASYAADLDAYLDFAGGKIDQAGLDKRLTAREMIADTADQKAGWHLQVAQRLLEQGMAEQAEGEFHKAAALKPADPATQAVMVRVLLGLGKVKEAEETLRGIKEQGLSPADTNLLRGRVALALEHWEEAAKFLAEATTLNPAPSEACYYLGQVYQHQQEWKNAAEAFRKAYETRGSR